MIFPLERLVGLDTSIFEIDMNIYSLILRKGNPVAIVFKEENPPIQHDGNKTIWVGKLSSEQYENLKKCLLNANIEIEESIIPFPQKSPVSFFASEV